jgi:uncharacterized membrane protein YtjA (UPF0391 family)
MLKYAAISLITALIALAFILFSGVLIHGAVWLAKGIFVVALILFIVFFAWDVMKKRSSKKS